MEEERFSSLFVCISVSSVTSHPRARRNPRLTFPVILVATPPAAVLSDVSRYKTMCYVVNDASSHAQRSADHISLSGPCRSKS
jgi:hypothetical protein